MAKNTKQTNNKGKVTAAKKQAANSAPLEQTTDKAVVSSTTTKKSATAKKASTSKKATTTKKAAAIKKTDSPKKTSTTKKTAAIKKADSSKKINTTKKTAATKTESPKKASATKKTATVKKTDGTKKASTTKKTAVAKKTNTAKKTATAKKTNTTKKTTATNNTMETKKANAVNEKKTVNNTPPSKPTKATHKIKRQISTAIKHFKTKNNNQTQTQKGIAESTPAVKTKKSHIVSDNKKAKKWTKVGRFLWRTTCVLFTFIFILTIAVTYFAYPIYLEYQESLPSLSLSKITAKMASNTMVYDRFDNPVTSLAEESYVSVTYDELPQSLIDAFNAAEDSRYYVHKGIDGPRTIKAVLVNALGKEVTSGGSTITQQLVKLTSLKEKIATEGPEYKESNERKVHEWILAYQLEQQMDKEDIFTAYVNSLGYGRLIGVGTAAKRYFNKPISDLTLPEAALLAGIPQSSTTNNPYRFMDTATERYQDVVGLLELHKYITPAEAQAIKYLPLSNILLTNQEDFINQNAAYFSGIEAELNQLLNVDNSDGSIELIPYYTGLKIYTGLDVEQQNYANMIMNTEEVVPYSQMLQNIPYYYNNGIYEDNNLQAAFAVVNPRNGEIPAIGAARNFNGFNMALHGYRSPGSSIKPLIDYAPGMEKFGWTGSTGFMDKKTYYSGTRSEVYNFSSTVSNKNVSVNQAIAQSLNTVAVQAMQQVGVDYAGKFVDSIGISRAGELLAENNLYESAALGGGLETTTVEMAGAYASFANGGQYNKPHFIRRIETADGEVIYEHKENNTQMMSTSTASNITNSLIYTRWSGTPASGRRQVSSSINFAAKTGTSSYATSDRRAYGLSGAAEKDHWIVGYSPEYSIAVWTGFNIENPEILMQTKGNVNANKSYGSYIMQAWMNNFAPAYTDFDFYRDENPNAAISGMVLQTDIDSHIISWSVPEVAFPISMTDDIRMDKGSIVYDISLIINDEETLIADALPQDITSFNYKAFLPPYNETDTIKIKIHARLSNNNDNVSTSTRIRTIQKPKKVEEEHKE